MFGLGMRHLSVGAFGLAWEPRVSLSGMTPSTKGLFPLRRVTYVGCSVLRKEKSRRTRFLCLLRVSSGLGLVESRELWAQVGALFLSSRMRLGLWLHLGCVIVVESRGQLQVFNLKNHPSTFVF